MTYSEFNMSETIVNKSQKMSVYALLCTLIDKTVFNIGAVHDADHARIKTHIFNTVAMKAMGKENV